MGVEEKKQRFFADFLLRVFYFSQNYSIFAPIFELYPFVNMV